MSMTKKWGTRLGAALAPRVTELAPNASAAFVHQALDRAISGVGPLPGAAAAADKALAANDGDVARAIHDVIEAHVRYAGVQGFLTNLGGLVTMAVTVPANVVGLAVIQCRMVAAIVHLRGYDLHEPQVRVGILGCLLGDDKILALIKDGTLAGTPMELADDPVGTTGLNTVLANEVASELISRAAGKRMASTVGRRIPVVGGVVGAGTDAYVTWRVGRYVDREFLPRSAGQSTGRPRKRR